MHKLYNWMPYGEIGCSNLFRGGFTSELGCTMYEFVCRLANLVALWRMRMPIGECVCPKAIMNANWPFWLHYSEFECRLVILAALSAKLNDLFILSHALCANLNDLSSLLHALSAKLDGKTYTLISVSCK